MDNLEIARVLAEVGDLLEIQDANPFRVRAYRNAVRTIEAQTTPLAEMLERGADLTELPGIGKEMASHVAELVRTGRLAALAELEAQTPRSLVELMRVPGLGPKKAKRLWKELGIESIADLEKAARAGKIAALEGFGAKSQEKILQGIGTAQRLAQRMGIAEADLVLEPLLTHLRQAPGLERLEAAGSWRRRKESVGDLDLLATARDPAAVMDHFVRYPGVARVDARGETKCTVVLRSGVQADLRIVPEKSFGAALVYFTGSKEHNIRLRAMAVDRGLRISEYGVFQEPTRKRRAEREEAAAERDPWAGKWLAGKREEDVYRTLRLPWIPPELREDRGEIEAAAKGKLPKLLERGDLRGDLQMHTTWSDGQETVAAMLAACSERGYEYCAITDHSKALAMVRGLDARRLKQQWREMDRVAPKYPQIRLLRSMEVDILADGSLDLEDELLEKLDLVLVTVHSKFDLDPGRQTKRILKAIQHPAAQVLGHPTGRRRGIREAMRFDVDEVLQACAELGVAVELNANPERLDLKDTHLMRAKELGCKITISTDAHSPRDLDLMRYGVEQARRARLTKADVLNAQPLAKLLAQLRPRAGA